MAFAGGIAQEDKRETKNRAPKKSKINVTMDTLGLGKAFHHSNLNLS